MMSYTKFESSGWFQTRRYLNIWKLHLKKTYFNLWSGELKGITYGGFYIYINLEILPLCTEPWNDTRCISIPWYLCHVSKAFWWINGVYRYWLWIPLTPFNYISCNIKLTNNLDTCYEKRSVLKGLTIQLQFTVEYHG